MVEYLPPDPDAADPPFLWGNHDVVRDRLGDNTEDISFETGAVMLRVLSPAHYWERAKTESGMFIVALENTREADQQDLRVEMIETIKRYYNDSENGVRMEYRLTSCSRR